jgi:transcriptional regulator GlxA family with amidase domain
VINQRNGNAALEEQGCLHESTLDEKKYYSVEQLANLWQVSPRMIERIFMNDPQVIRIDTNYQGEQRIGLRIPGARARLVNQQV